MSGIRERAEKVKRFHNNIKAAAKEGDVQLKQITSDKEVCNAYKNFLEDTVCRFPTMIILQENSILNVAAMVEGYYFAYAKKPVVDENPVSPQLVSQSKALVGSICNLLKRRIIDKVAVENFCERYNEFIGDLYIVRPPSEAFVLRGVIDELAHLSCLTESGCKNDGSGPLIQERLIRKLEAAKLKFGAEKVTKMLEGYDFGPYLS